MLPVWKLKTKNLKLKSNQGFTLIELLVVMAVMSILVGVGVNTFSIAQKKARDSKRKADLRTIQTALVAYAVNNNGKYPIAVEPCPTGGNLNPLDDNNVLLPNYIQSLPKDPIGGDCKVRDNSNTVQNTLFGYDYITTGVGDKYFLVARLEDSGDPQTCSGVSGATKPCPTMGTGNVGGEITGNQMYVVTDPDFIAPPPATPTPTTP